MTENNISTTNTTTKMCKRIWYVLCALSMVIVVASCNRLLPRISSYKKNPIRIPQNHTLTWYPQYIISNEDYGRMFEEKNTRSKVRDIIRRADIFRIIDIDGEYIDGFIWYKVRFVTQATDDAHAEGWVLLRDAIRTYALNKAQYISRKIIRTGKAEALLFNDTQKP